MTAAAFPLWFLKTYVSDFSDLNAAYGVKAAAGSALGDKYDFNMAGTDANRAPFDEGYPAQGGYLFASINPNIAAWREGTTGTPSLSAVDWFGVQVLFVNGGAKDVNFAIDAIDIGRGLFAVGTAFDLSALITTDQNTIANRWGVVAGAPGAFDCIGLVTIGRDSGGTAQATMDDFSIITFPDGYQGPGDVGFLADLDTASSDIAFSGLYISDGALATSDTRADLVFSGTTGVGGIFGTVRNFRNVTLTSVTPILNADIECQLLTQASADISASVIRTNSLTSVATLQDPTFGSTTDLFDVEFIQAGAGHAIEIDTAGSYDFNDLIFTGYNVADEEDDSALDITETTGTVTININGGSTPTFKSAGATVVIVAGAVTLSFHVIESDPPRADIQDARVLVQAAATGPLPYQESVTITRVTTTASVAHTAHGLANGQKVNIQGAVQPEYNGVQTISNVTTNAYDYTVAGSPTTPATGTIESTAVIIEGLTNVAGVISDTRTYAADQDYEGRIRKSTASPYYKNSPQTGTIDKDIGQSVTVGMISDE